MRNLRIGIDLGGTKIEGIALDGEGGERRRERVSTPRGDYEAGLEAITGLVSRFEADLGTKGSVGLGIPGCLSPASGLVKNANSTWLNGRDLKTDIEARLDRPVRIENDANCLAVSEAVDGAGSGAALVFAVILGTGVGGGLAFETRPWIGPNAIAGEWSHNSLPWPRDEERPGPSCYCGRQGCIETFLSGPGLAHDHYERSGEQCVPEAIVASAEAGDGTARASIARYRERLGRALASIINLLDPEVIVLGGGLSNLPGLAESLPETIAPHVFSDVCTTPVRRSRHGDSSGVRGAAWLWDEVSGDRA